MKYMILKMMIGLTDSEQNSFDTMPQIPFEVYYQDYNKTINVIATCKADSKTIILYFDPSTATIYPVVQATVTKAFDMPGVTRVGICRVNK